MFLIRRIHDAELPANQAAIEAVQKIFRARFPGVRDADITGLADKLRDPFAYRFTAVLYVAEQKRNVVGFALVLREPKLQFCYLDFIAADIDARGGTGGALYGRVREDAKAFGARGIFFECLPDEPSAYTERELADASLLKENRARLRFYERWGARPIIDTGYETPVNPSDTGLPHLVLDPLDRKAPVTGAFVREVVRAVLERKYDYLCPPEYVESVVSSIPDGPVHLRVPRYVRGVERPTSPGIQAAMVVNDRHEIHHVRERGYVEAPVRIDAILEDLDPTGIFRHVKPKEHGLDPILQVHDRELVAYLDRACAKVAEGKSLYPYVFPIRNAARPPKDLAVRAGYFCIDTFTPLNRNAFRAARRAVDCALTAADRILAGERLTYALVRPPGHHAERKVYGGFCYFNNAAIAANHLAQHGKVAILDVDYHHGNGQQDIFYSRSDVLTVSIHGDPSFAYPYFSGFADEVGEGPGEGFNFNLPLSEHIDGARYRKHLATALKRVREFSPTFVVVALGLDTAKGDPTGSWSLSSDDFAQNGHLIGQLNRPLLVVQEGGYRSRNLGSNARGFFTGIAKALRTV